jgi:hypothetical protein
VGQLFVIPSRFCSIAAILRRGPKNWYHLIKWETRHDQFTHGAWIKGRIYPQQCDLSPDGQLLVYAIAKFDARDTGFGHVWVAVSRFPWLEALTVWPLTSTHAIETRTGRCKFTAPTTLWGVSAKGTHPDYPVGRLRIASAPPEPHVAETTVPEADWSGIDRAGKVIFSKGDLLYRRDNDEDVLVADFSNLTPDSQPAPEWAGKPI